MRQQYHFKKVGNDIFIWDVNTLIKRYSNLPIFEIPISEIAELDEPFWYQNTGDSPTCRSVSEHAKLIQEADLDYPILLHPDGSVMDGMHRVCKAFLQGNKHIKAIQLIEIPSPDYINVAAESLPY